MFESAVYIRRERSIARSLVSLPLALAVQAGFSAAFLLYTLLARDALAPPERAWAALWSEPPKITLVGGATAPRPRRGEAPAAAAPRDDRLKPPATAPAAVRPEEPGPVRPEPAPDGPVVTGALPGEGPGGPSILPLVAGPGPREIVRAGGRVRPPVLLEQVPPAYPPAARMMGLSGRVVLQVLVDEEGRVEEVQVVSATSAIFVQPAVEAVKRWRYSRPVDVAGQRVACYLPVTVTFSIG